MTSEAWSMLSDQQRQSMEWLAARINAHLVKMERIRNPLPALTATTSSSRNSQPSVSGARRASSATKRTTERKPTPSRKVSILCTYTEGTMECISLNNHDGDHRLVDMS